MTSAERGSNTLAELATLATRRPAIVLDDDPTGTQTLRDVPVLTRWSAEAIGRHLDQPVVFLSTNSRSLDQEEAVQLVRGAASAALAAARARHRSISLVSRSDSTLRGHFPAETAAIADAAGMKEARVLLAPFFADGRRITVDDVHYVERDGQRIPVGETEYARDSVFGYRSSNLREWAAEKHAAAGLPTPPLASLDLRVVRDGGADGVCEALLGLAPGGIALASAQTDADIETVALGALRAEEAGLPLVARVAASYVRARAGRPPASLLSAAELTATGPGIVVVGSHVETTTRQLRRLVEAAGDSLAVHEMPLEPLLNGDRETLSVAAAAIEAALRGGRSAVVVSERKRRDVGLTGARAISASLAAIVSRIDVRPGWVLAKGGITSSDVAIGGLGIAEALVGGQLVPGVPVWICGPDSRWPGLSLVVFPGNVGDDDALAEAVALLSATTEKPTTA